ncbi:MAG: aminotransferase class I/II-fold pyridoxal phosphate-dependent enzyme, partial [Oscillospiraceae bacterium]|nr:aminotransferase class I/II-fold pyridoxal phosphate-dependent enzyme [Oscillospiraceae bacterium]
MHDFISERVKALTPYTPGEQPQDRKYVKLNTNESPYPPAPGVADAVSAEAEKLRLYSDPENHLLVEALAEAYGLSADEITVGNGSDELLNFAFIAFCDQNCPALFPDITYGFYPVFASVNGLPYEEIPLNDALEINFADDHGKKGTVFLANPNAPTGIARSRSEIESFLKSRPDSMLVVDEAYVDFGAESMLPLIREYDNLLVIQTFSKSRS